MGMLQMGFDQPVVTSKKNLQISEADYAR